MKENLIEIFPYTSKTCIMYITIISIYNFLTKFIILN